MPEQSIAFDRAADYYDETRGFPPEEAAHIGAFVAEQLPPQGRVLEIGVGTGRVALPVASHVAAYYGIDLSVPMMQRLQAKQTDERIFVARADATRLPFPDHSVDAVVAVHVFHLIADWRQALGEVARVLKPGAYLLNCFNDDDEHTLFAKLWKTWEATMPDGGRTKTGVKFHKDTDFLAQAGWQQVSERAYAYAARTTPNVFLDRLRRRVFSSMWQLSDDDVAAGIAAVEDAMAQEFVGPEQVMDWTIHFRVQAYVPPGSGTA